MTHRSCFVALAILLAAFASPDAAAQAGRSWPSSRMPRPLPAREAAFPPYELKTLPNGLRVVVVHQDEQPVVSLRLIVGAGAARDPLGRAGVAALAALLLDQGTTARDARQLAETIDAAGGRLETGLGRDLSFAHVVVMKDSFALGMQLLAEIIRTPAFAGEELERQRRQMLSALQVSYQDPQYLANLVFGRLVYGDSPYGSPANGTPESVERITRHDLVAFHGAYFAPNNSLLGVVGDVDSAQAMDLVARSFGDWPRRDVPPFEPVAPPTPARRLIVLDKPDAVQTEIRVGQLGIPRGNPDFLAVDLAINILGGEGANRLHRVLRAERGLAYGASADTETFRRSGQFVAETSTRSDATGEVLRLIVDEYSRLRRERVGDEEIAEAKAYLTGHFPLTIETPDDIATQVLNVLFYDLPLEELQTFRQRVNALGVDDLARVVWRYVNPDRLSVVLVGNASAFAGQLRGVGFGRYEVIPLSDLDVTASDLRRKETGKGQASAAAGGAAWPRWLPDPLAGLREPHGAAAARVAPTGESAVTTAPGQAPVSPTTSSRQPQGGQATGGAAPTAPAQSTTSAEALVRRAIEGKGGLEKLKSIETVRATAVTTVMLPSGPTRTETTTYIEYPDRFRVEAHLPTGVVVQVYAGENNVWAQDPRKGVIDVPPQVRKDFKASVDRDIIPLLLRAARGGLRLSLLPPDPEAEGVRPVELSGDGLDPVTLFIEEKTGLILRESYRLPGGTGTADEIFGDYRDVDGLKVAFKASVRRNNLPVLDRVVTDFRLNVPVPAGLFDRPKAE